jgi:Protein of unknown function (DUF1553)/Protein of unknown function (DUF1549)
MNRWLALALSVVALGSAARGGEHWAFAPLLVVEPPRDQQAGHPIDCFLNAQIRAQDVTLAPPADKRILIRRATFDLTGLPPKPEEIDTFLNDNAPNAYVKLIDRLLASPHYGERWGRHWLDLARYADTAGETADFPVPHAWRYRNWVISSLNRDLPYNQFLREQFAGDILAKQAGVSDARFAELHAATGFVSVARRFGYDILHDHFLTIEDTIDTLGKTVLGLTLACARCHDHKYDPISRFDYYALYGIFESTRYPHPGSEKVKTSSGLTMVAPRSEKNWWQRLRAVEPIYAVTEGEAHDAQLHKRGDPEDRGEVVPRRFPQLFGGQPVPKGAGSGRLQLAEWILGPARHLTARVMVNRIWQQHFGVGLVSTPNDFGTRGSPPSHPELLDWLARRFIDSGWSIKTMHRLIMSSSAYQRASQPSADIWLASFSRRRLSAEEIRDSILAVSGDLDRTPGTRHPFPAEKTWGFTQHAPFSAVYEHDKRSVYLMVQRIKRHPFLALFDGPDANASTPDRHATTVPTQALFFLNDPFVHAKSANMAGRLESMASDEARLERAYRLAYGRFPTASERETAARFVSGYAADSNRTAAWAAWIRVMISSNEFLYVD